MSKLDQLHWLQRATSPPGGGQRYKLSAVLIYQTWVSLMWWAVDKLLSDCSGAVIGALRWVGARFVKNGVWVDFATLCGTARPTAHKIHAVCATYGTVFTDPALLEPGDLGFHWNRWKLRWSHVWFDDGQQTWEYGDGTSRSAMHTTEWQRAKYGAKYVGYGRLPHDLGGLTPPGEVPTLPPLALPIGPGYPDGTVVRLVKGVLRWVVPGCTLYTGDTESGRSFEPYTAGWVKKLQAAAGLPETGIIDEATMTAMQQALRALVPPRPAPQDTTEIRWVQERLLAHLGHFDLAMGQLSGYTIELLKVFQWLRRMPVTGAVDDATLAELAKQPVFPYLSRPTKNRYAGLAVRHLKRHGFAKWLSDWTEDYGWWLGQAVAEWRMYEGLPAGTHLGPEGSWPALLE